MQKICIVFKKGLKSTHKYPCDQFRQQNYIQENPLFGHIIKICLFSLKLIIFKIRFHHEYRKIIIS